MPVERRERVTAIWLGSTGNGRNPMFNGRRQPSSGGTSRMTRECQVRFCERLRVKFPGPTRQTRLLPHRNVEDASLRAADITASILFGAARVQVPGLLATACPATGLRAMSWATIGSCQIGMLQPMRQIGLAGSGFQHDRSARERIDAIGKLQRFLDQLLNQQYSGPFLA